MSGKLQIKLNENGRINSCIWVTGTQMFIILFSVHVFENFPIKLKIFKIQIKKFFFNFLI